MEAKLRKKKKKLLSKKNSNKDLKKKLAEAITQVEEAKEKTKLVKVDVLKAIDDYTKSAAFEEEVTEASAYTYECGFNDCKAKVMKLFQNLDLNKVILQEGETAKEGEIQEKHAKEATIEEAAPSIVVEASVEDQSL